MKRRIVIDTETTGLEAKEDRLCEVAAIEIDENNLPIRTFHAYINPEMPMPYFALRIHKLNDEFLADKPTFDEVADALRDFLSGAMLIAHNARFDIGFLDAEFARIGYPTLSEMGCDSLCTLELARYKLDLPRYSLNALCDWFSINRTAREGAHGALVDTQLLIDVYGRLCEE